MDSKDEFEKARKNIINVQESKTLPLATYFTGRASVEVDIDGVKHSFETKQVTTNWSGGADHVVIRGEGREAIEILFNHDLKDGVHRFKDQWDGGGSIHYTDESGNFQAYYWYGHLYVAASDGGKTKYGSFDVDLLPLHITERVKLRACFFCHRNE